MTAVAQALSAALLDFVWQGLLMAFLLWIALFILKDRSARARYAASSLALAAMAVLPVVTACLAYHAPATSQAPAGWASAAGPMIGRVIVASGGAAFNFANFAAWLERYALPAWSLGVLLFSLRLVWAGRRVSALRRQSQPPDAALLAVMARLRERMKLARPVRVLIAVAADCPSVVGWLRPVVLLPAATVVGLTPAQLEAVLAHELAHILRYDYLVNMLQTVVETLLFYHPAVWWASARIRHERELCCDDLAVVSCGDALCYARALTRLERLRVAAPGLALSITGGSLLYRIRRIVGEAGEGHAPSKLSGILALSLGLLCLSLNMPWARGQQVAQAVSPAFSANTGVPDDPGVQVDLGGASVIHREPVEYPDAALEKGIQGNVLVEATLDAEGAVTDARVLSGPQELRKAALASVLDWHFTHDAAGSTRQVSIAFQLPAEGAAAPTGGVSGGIGGGVSGGIGGGVGGGIGSGVAELEAQILSSEAQLLALQKQRQSAAANAQMLQKQLQDLRQSSALAESAPALAESQKAQMAALQKLLAEAQSLKASEDHIVVAGKVKSITVEGLTAPQRDELLSKLPVHVGETLTGDSIEKIDEVVKLFHEHFSVSINGRDGQVDIRIAPPDSVK